MISNLDNETLICAKCLKEIEGIKYISGNKAFCHTCYNKCDKCDKYKKVLINIRDIINLEIGESM
jgi:hypothetical protein